MLNLIDPKTNHKLKIDEELILGRESPGLKDPLLSKQHLTFIRGSSGYYVADLGSKNGTKLNGEKLEPQLGKRLKAGDLIQFGNSELKVLAASVPTQDGPAVHETKALKAPIYGYILAAILVVIALVLIF